MKNNMKIYFVADEKGKIILNSFGTTEQNAIDRFCYPALNWKAYKDSGFHVVNCEIPFNPSLDYN